MNIGSNINQLLVEKIATKGELLKCDDMIPVRYNGHPGEPMDSLSILSRGPDYRWFGKRMKDGEVQFYGAHPVYIRAGGEAVVPNVPENLAILASFQPRPLYERFETESGHEMRKVGMLPPLYERIGVSAAGTPSIGAMSDAELSSLTQQLLGELQNRRAPAPAAAPAEPPMPKSVEVARAEAVQRAQDEVTSAAGLVAAAQEDFDTAPDEKSKAKVKKTLDAANESLTAAQAKLDELNKTTNAAG